MRQWSGRFTIEPANPTDAHRPLGAEHDLAAILSHVEDRVVVNDYTIRYDKKIYQIARGEIRSGLRGATVRVEERLDQSVWVRFRERYLTVRVCASQSKAPAPAPVPKLPAILTRQARGQFDERLQPAQQPPTMENYPAGAGKRRGRGEGPVRRVVGANLSRPAGSFG